MQQLLAKKWPFHNVLLISFGECLYGIEILSRICAIFDMSTSHNTHEPQERIKLHQIIQKLCKNNVVMHHKAVVMDINCVYQLVLGRSSDTIKNTTPPSSIDANLTRQFHLQWSEFSTIQETFLEFTSVQCELVIAEERDNIESDWYGISDDSKVVRFLYEDSDIHTPNEIFRPYQSHLITTHTYMHSYQAKVEHFNAALLKLKRTTQERLQNSCCTLGVRPEHFLWVDKKCTLCLNTFDWQCEVRTCTQAYNFHLFHAKCVENMVSTLFSDDEDATMKCPNCRDEWQQ